MQLIVRKENLTDKKHIEDWKVDQYNRNRNHKDWVTDYNEFLYVMDIISKRYGREI